MKESHVFPTIPIEQLRNRGPRAGLGLRAIDELLQIAYTEEEAGKSADALSFRRGSSARGYPHPSDPGLHLARWRQSIEVALFDTQSDGDEMHLNAGEGTFQTGRW